MRKKNSSSFVDEGFFFSWGRRNRRLPSKKASSSFPEENIIVFFSSLRRTLFLCYENITFSLIEEEFFFSPWTRIFLRFYKKISYSSLPNKDPFFLSSLKRPIYHIYEKSFFYCSLRRPRLLFNKKTFSCLEALFSSITHSCSLKRRPSIIPF